MKMRQAKQMIGKEGLAQENMGGKKKKAKGKPAPAPWANQSSYRPPAPPVDSGQWKYNVQVK